ncbi:hypothetical protein [Nevskia ramosa]|uniref:hypothetical protein n=1 Tax=Nevskia ramosa TaxID=64002 RepID=UPI0003B2EF02|nr:hypothetical protein [Nevskia ramosa]
MSQPRPSPEYAETIGDAFRETGRGVALFKRNPNRRALLIVNTSSSGQLYLSFGGPATPLHLRLGPGASFSETQSAPANEVWVMALQPCPFYAFEG